jgi:signal transduction histidine kinase
MAVVRVHRLDRMHLLRLVWLSLLLCSVGSAEEPLARFADLRALSAEAAESGVPIRVEGTVLGLNPAAPFHFFMHDGTAGCFIKTRRSGRPDQLAPGDRVRVEGISDPLGYYPSVREGSVTILGRGEMPQPVEPAAGEMFSPELDSQWVEVPAVITGFEIGDDRVTLAVEVNGLPFKAELPMSADAEQRAAGLMQRPVKLGGVMGTIFNYQRQMTDRHFFVPSFDAIRPAVPQLDGGETHLVMVSQLLISGFGPTMPVRLRGVITQIDPKGFYLRDSTGSTLVEGVVGDGMKPGTLVEAEGFGAVAPYRPVLRAAQVRKLGENEPVAAVDFAFDLPAMSRLHSELVTLEADFLGRRDGPVDTILQFRAGDVFFEALQPHGKGSLIPPMTSLDRVRLTGICELTTTHALARRDWVDGFRIHLPQSGGIEVIRHAPWWNPRRLLVALGVMSGMAALGFLGAWTMRRQVKRQMAVISDKLRAEAVNEERDRMARELHDTLEQQLSGVALQLDGLDHAVHQNPAAVSSVLLLARRMLRYTRLEARRSVWDLRSKVLEREGLHAALQTIQETSGDSAGSAITVEVTGEERVHPPGVDFHILRIAQEAVTNAIKHGQAQSILISISYLPDATSLIVSDDGSGFDSGTAPSRGPHFGLLGMRERAAKIGASLAIDSQPGQGCRVRLIMPHPCPRPNTP